MPAQRVASAVPVRSDPSTQPPHLRNKLLARHRFEVLVHGHLLAGSRRAVGDSRCRPEREFGPRIDGPAKDRARCEVLPPMPAGDRSWRARPLAASLSDWDRVHDGSVPCRLRHDGVSLVLDGRTTRFEIDISSQGRDADRRGVRPWLRGGGQIVEHLALHRDYRLEPLAACALTAARTHARCRTLTQGRLHTLAASWIVKSKYG